MSKNNSNPSKNNSNTRIFYMAQIFNDKTMLGSFVGCWGGIGGWGGYCTYSRVIDEIKQYAQNQSKKTSYNKCQILKIVSSHPRVLGIYKESLEFGTKEELFNFPLTQDLREAQEILDSSAVSCELEFNLVL